MRILHENNLHYDVHASMNYPSNERTYVDWNKILEFDFERSTNRSMNFICRETIHFLTWKSSISFRVEVLFVVDGGVGGVSTTVSSMG